MAQPTQLVGPFELCLYAEDKGKSVLLKSVTIERLVVDMAETIAELSVSPALCAWSSRNTDRQLLVRRFRPELGLRPQLNSCGLIIPTFRPPSASLILFNKSLKWQEALSGWSPWVVKAETTADEDASRLDERCYEAALSLVQIVLAAKADPELPRNYQVCSPFFTPCQQPIPCLRS